jgi:acyl-coenzyme A synthetase/AMP-(fatty) acid ligase
VTGIPHERLGAVPVAAVQLSPGVDAPTPEALLALARTQLTPYEVPVEIKIVAELPRTAAMKVDKRALLALFGVEQSNTVAG